MRKRPIGAAVPSAPKGGKLPAAGTVRGPTTRRAARPDGRNLRDVRPIRITPGYIKYAEGSALIEAGHTRVL